MLNCHLAKAELIPEWSKSPGPSFRPRSAIISIQGLNDHNCGLPFLTPLSLIREVLGGKQQTTQLGTTRDYDRTLKEIPQFVKCIDTQGCTLRVLLALVQRTDQMVITSRVITVRV